MGQVVLGREKHSVILIGLGERDIGMSARKRGPILYTTWWGERRIVYVCKISKSYILRGEGRKVSLPVKYDQSYILLDGGEKGISWPTCATEIGPILYTTLLDEKGSSMYAREIGPILYAAYIKGIICLPGK